MEPRLILAYLLIMLLLAAAAFMAVRVIRERQIERQTMRRSRRSRR
ncbi:MAG: hypothetical protein KKC79_09055 [Gammaproteobacteria bacterium]|nr:hypothetical protein [Gammaproteobacteria bacterium]MBU2408784.1 hypothetical protein [Gammaproteobacteria bacterium]